MVNFTKQPLVFQSFWFTSHSTGSPVHQFTSSFCFQINCPWPPASGRPQCRRPDCWGPTDLLHLQLGEQRCQSSAKMSEPSLQDHERSWNIKWNTLKLSEKKNKKMQFTLDITKRNERRNCWALALVQGADLKVKDNEAHLGAQRSTIFYDIL